MRDLLESDKLLFVVILNHFTQCKSHCRQFLFKIWAVSVFSPHIAILYMLYGLLRPPDILWDLCAISWDLERSTCYLLRGSSLKSFPFWDMQYTSNKVNHMVPRNFSSINRDKTVVYHVCGNIARYTIGDTGALGPSLTFRHVPPCTLSPSSQWERRIWVMWPSHLHIIMATHMHISGPWQWDALREPAMHPLTRIRPGI